MPDAIHRDKSSLGRFFEDFEIGQRIACPTPRAITAGDVSVYIALTGDRTPRWCGAEGLVHPLLVFHVVMGQTVRDVSLNAKANLGYAGMVWHRPVRVGDVLRTSIEVVGLKENRAGDAGIVWIRTAGRNGDGAPVLDYIRWVMVKKRGSASTPWRDAASVPMLPARVDPIEIDRSPGGGLPRAADTGGRYWFEDYALGERVHHHDGHTVNPSEHMSFTRLFQNSAKLHFDSVRTGGTPMVYGGYPMSVGYAAAFNGFENRLGIAAINGGTHSNPVHAGDTLYSCTDVLEADSLGNAPFGALRCRLLVVKGTNPADVDGFKPHEGGRHPHEGGRHRPDVVLDLDFWERMAKRPV